VNLQSAYRFASQDEDAIEGVVFKVRKVWEARVEGTPIQVRGETRRDAVELAIEEARASR
jgi:hypothetical protein